MIDSQEPSLADASGSATMRVDLTGVRQGKRGRGRGGTSRHIQRDNATDTTVSTGNSRGRGRGQTHQSRPRLSEHSVTASEPSTAGEKGPIALTGPLSALKGNVSAEPTEDEAEICFICASDVVHNSIAPCNHRTCHICSLRMRALYKTKACPHCRLAAETVVFTDSPDKRYEEYNPADFSSRDEILGINYEKSEIFEDTVLLLRYNCPDADCDVACLGWPDLHRHVKSAHHKVLCDLCTRNKKVFTHEHELFTQQSLRKHEKFGDDNPGAVDQSGFTGHPECGFCRQRFYGDDELFAHCRDRHERCHVCDSRSQGGRPQYYQDYNALDSHFRKDHFACMDRECLEKKFVVFGSEMDLKAHQLEAHPNGLTKDARRDARRVDLSGFDYRTPHQQDRPRREPRGRGRDPNAEPLPMSSAQPLRRDELAFQRSMAIQNAQSSNARTFGGQLTQSDPAPRTASPVITSLPTRSAAPTATGGGTSSADSLTPQEQARRLRHNVVIERAANLLGNEAAKVDIFRARISSFRSGQIVAGTLIDELYKLIDTSPAEFGKLMQELAEIYEDPQKRVDLLKKWSDWKAIHEDYPSLPGPSESTSTSNWAQGVGGARVLKLKSSTAQSGRSTISQAGRWGGSATNGKVPTANAFPSLKSTVNAVAASTSRPTASWTQSSSSQAANAPPKTNGSLPAANAFPALPAAQKPLSTVFSPGYKGQGVRRYNGPASVTNAWSGNKDVEAGGSTTDGVDGAQAAPANAKSKKGKKQVLYSWG